MTITSIRQTSPGRLTVTLESGEEIKSTLGVVTDRRLFSGQELDGEALDALRLDSARALAREKALTYVSQRQMSCREMRDKLRQKGVDEDTASYCVAWLLDHGLLDEESYAAAIVRHYAAKGYGPGRVRAELIRRGIPRELQEDALNAMPASDAKIDRFIASRLRDPEDRDEVRKLTAALYRRGFSGEEIRSALARFHADCEE